MTGGKKVQIKPSHDFTSKSILSRYKPGSDYLKYFYTYKDWCIFSPSETTVVLANNHNCEFYLTGSK